MFQDFLQERSAWMRSCVSGPTVINYREPREHSWCLYERVGFEASLTF